jgi:hypothetical protein
MDLQGNILLESKYRTYAADLQEAHIYLQEVHAACEGIKAAKERWGDLQAIYLVLDNTAACGSFRRSFSSNTTAMKMIIPVLQLAVALHVVSVTSAMNVADSASRNEPLCPVRSALTLKAVQDYARGVRDGAKMKLYDNKRPRANVIRHDEAEDDADGEHNWDCLRAMCLREEDYVTNSLDHVQS